MKSFIRHLLTSSGAIANRSEDQGQGQKSKKTEKEVKIIKLIVDNARNLRATNSCVDFCYVACGRDGGYLNQTSCIWDCAAPSLIIAEAGGKSN